MLVKINNKIINTEAISGIHIVVSEDAELMGTAIVYLMGGGSITLDEVEADEVCDFLTYYNGINGFQDLTPECPECKAQEEMN